MILLTACAFILILAGAAIVQFLAHTRTLDAHVRAAAPVADAGRYRPMLRLLSDEAIESTTDPALRRKLRDQRGDLFREYLRYLTEDYGNLLAGVRLIMSQSGIDRPDLARAIARNRVVFVFELCRIDVRLWLYKHGIGQTEALTVNLLELMGAVDVLRRQFTFLNESAVWGA
jgi:hypothetical protein